jgi:hypothetical protein
MVAGRAVALVQPSRSLQQLSNFPADFWCNISNCHHDDSSFNSQTIPKRSLRKKWDGTSRIDGSICINSLIKILIWLCSFIIFKVKDIRKIRVRSCASTLQYWSTVCNDTVLVQCTCTCTTRCTVFVDIGHNIKLSYSTTTSREIRSSY